MSNTNIILSERTPDAPLASVIIPVYNVSSYLTQCLESVVGQTFQNLDIILIDDGSTDDSGSICDRFASCDARIRVFHTENRGISAAKNLGIEEARGEYIMFVDSDDWIELNAVSMLLDAIIRNDSSIASAFCLDEHVGCTYSNLKGNEGERLLKGKDLLEAFADGNPRHIVWNKIYRPECFFELRFPEGHTYEDVATTWKIMRKIADSDSSVTVIPVALYHYRVRKSSVSRDLSYSILADAWNAYRGKLDGLIEFKDKVLPECFSQIARVWRNYNVISPGDKKRVKSLVAEMRDFSRKHFAYVKEGNFSKNTKIICFMSQSGSPLVMLAYRTAYGLRNLFKKRDRDYFD